MGVLRSLQQKGECPVEIEVLVVRKVWTNENSRIETCLSLLPFPVSQPMRKQFQNQTTRANIFMSIED